MEDTKERRGTDRVHIMTSVEIDLGGAKVEATALDLSTSGVSVWAPQGVKPGGPLTVTMTLDDQGPLTISGTLAREFESDGGAVWGIAFDALAPDVRARIEAYLATQ